MQKEKSPYYYLQQQQGVLAPSERRETPVPAKQYWMGLCFFSDDILFATAIEGVIAVISPRKISALPIKQDSLVGLSTYNGQVLPIVDVKKVFWHQKSEMNHYSKILVFQHRTSLWGFLVCKVEGLKRFDCDSFEKVELAPHIPYSQFVNQIYFQDQQRCARLDLSTFISEMYIK